MSHTAMKGKVSMVMPCYNKVEYIGEMLDSIVAQTWDNIELILVNDGSTDGTREKISEYEPQIKARGFSLVIIDQKNAGVCAAAKAGLERVSGDYVCLVDADDELDSVYVSTMAGWLERNADYDYCVCGGITYTGRGNQKLFRPYVRQDVYDGDLSLIERYLFRLIRPTVWIYMLRAEYMRKCNIPSTYFTDSKGSHEPGFIIPILSFNGRFQYFPLPLYHFNCNDEGHSRSDNFEYMTSFFKEYNLLCRIAIDRLHDSVADKERRSVLKEISELAMLFYVSNYRTAIDGLNYNEAEALNKLFDKTSAIFLSCLTIGTSESADAKKTLFERLYEALLRGADNRQLIMNDEGIYNFKRDFHWYAKRLALQPMVSMVVPCYNKEQWIGDMLDSVIAQEWGNMEVILVNDGSTDGTREIIKQHAPAIKKRGYNLIIIDQENQGLAAAIKTGLKRATGDFVCMPDCDDELDPEYVSAMAGWLWEHPDDKWVACDMDWRSWDSSSQIDDNQAPTDDEYRYKLLESFLLLRICTSVCVLMIRTNYLRECNVLENFDLDARNIQEPQVFIPLALGGAPIVHIHKPLYKNEPKEGSISYQVQQTYDASFNHVSAYSALNRRVLASYKELNSYDEFLLHTSYMEFQKLYVGRFAEYKSKYEENLSNLIHKHNASSLGKKRLICIDEAKRIGFLTLLNYVSDKLIGRSEYKIIQRKGNGRIIAYAAFGTAAMNVKAGLLSSDIKPDIYWDIKAVEEDFVGGVPVVRPNFPTLAPDDTVLILLINKKLVEEVKHNIEVSERQAIIYYYEDVMDYLTHYHLGV